MTSIATSGSTETMAYDAFGRRVQKAVPSGPTYSYIYDASGRLATVYSTFVGWYKDNVFAGSGSAIIASENASGGACTTCYYTTDHLGSTRMLTDQYGDAVTRHDYMPFGVEIAANTDSRGPTFGSTTDVIEKFTGQIRNQEAGQDYFNARFFTAAVGRFSSVDPGNAGASLWSSQSWNGYAYVLGNPLAFVDPTGTDCGQNANPEIPCVTFTDTVTTTGGSDNAPIGTWAWWMDGGWLTAVGGVVPTYTVTGTGVANRNPQPVSTPPKKGTQTCPAVPARPPSANLAANASEARTLRWLLPPFKEFFFYLDVRNGSQWDYKQQGRTLSDLGSITASPYQDFGNFNFGVVGAAAGFPTQELLRGAGYAQQQAGTSSPQWGHWYSPIPHMAMIRLIRR